MTIDKSKSGKIRMTILTIAFVLAAMAAFFIYNGNSVVTALNSMSIKDGKSYNTKVLKIEFENPGVFRTLRFHIDGKDVTDNVNYNGQKGELVLNNLEQGNHRLIVGVSDGINPYTLTPLEEFINFNVDTNPPSISIKTPKRDLIKDQEIIVSGKSEPDSSVVIDVNGKKYRTFTFKTGDFIQKVFINEEVSRVKIRVTDRAGNSSIVFKKLILDRHPPEILVKAPSDKSVLEENKSEIKVKITDTGSGLKKCWFEIDGVKVEGKYNPVDQTLSAILEKLDEGAYEVTAVAQDDAGWKSEKKWKFTINSIEEPGLHTLRPGAVGKDVKSVQQRLYRMGLLKKEQITGVYDSPTTTAVMEIQKRKGIQASGIIDRKTLTAMSNKIYIYLNEFALYLISPDDTVVKKYMIACGSPYYPTPPGEYFVKEKIYYPAWYPPPSPWARGAKPVPPGRNNPLGTRWIGLNSDILGIHGTPSSWSIGSAASHGCIRMFIHEVEELYDLVYIGTPVTIFPRRPKEHEKYKTDTESHKTTASAQG